jgi:hypothetical protein
MYVALTDPTLIAARQAIHDGRYVIVPTGDHVPGSTPFEQLFASELEELFRPSSISILLYSDPSIVIVQTWLEGVCWTIVAQKAPSNFTLSGTQGCS